MSITLKGIFSTLNALQSIKRRRKEESRKQKDLEQWQATHAPAPLKGILKGSKTNDGGDTPKRILEDSHVHEGERTKRRREAVQVVAAQRHRDSDHFIEYQLRTGVQPLDGEAPSPLLRQKDSSICTFRAITNDYA